MIDHFPKVLETQKTTKDIRTDNETKYFVNELYALNSE